MKANLLASIIWILILAGFMADFSAIIARLVRINCFDWFARIVFAKACLFPVLALVFFVSFPVDE